MKRVGIALGLGLIALAIILWRLDGRDDGAPKSVAATAPPPRTPAKRVDPKAQPTAALAGIVRDRASEQPIANATVCVVYEVDDRQCVQTSADGRYAIASVVRTEAALVASAAKYQTKRSAVPVLDPGEQLAIDVALAGGAVELTGVVEDILGGPIAKAHVFAEHARVETDEQGRFSIWMGPVGDYRSVEARATGYGPRSQPVKVPGEVVIALAPESSITGTVVDATTGAPLAGARVFAYPQRTEVTTGDDGTFTVEGLRAGDYQLEASTASRYGRLGRLVPVGIGELVDGVVVEVFPARAVVATVDVVGDPKICSPTPALHDWHVSIAPPWRDDAGRFHFDGVPPGVYTVSLGCGAQLPPLAVNGEDVEVTWRLESGGVVKGKIITNQPRDDRDDVLVQLDLAGSLRPPIINRASGQTFELRGIPAGTYTLRATFNNSLGKPHTFEIKNGQTVEHDVVIDDAGRGRIVGTVTEKGAPVKTATVHAIGTNTMHSFDAPVREGRYELDVPTGVYRLYANSRSARGDAKGVFEVEVGKTTKLDFDLVNAYDSDLVAGISPREPAGRYELTGRVVDAQNQPVPGAIVTAVEKGFWQPDEEPSLRVTTRTDGSFLIVSKSSRINVDVYRVGGGRAAVTLEAGKPATVTLAAKPQITGTVVLANGSPAPRFQIRIGDGGAARTENFDYTGGRFAIPDPGEYPLRIAAVINGLHGEPVTLTAAAAKTSVVLRLPNTVTLTGRVLDASTRQPIANVRIGGRQGVDGWAPWFIHADQVSGADGTFTLRDLPPGPLMLEVTPPLDTWSVQSVNITVPDKPGDIGEIGLAQTRKR